MGDTADDDTEREMLITIVGIRNYEGRFPFSGGRQLIGVKEPDNKYDNKAIKILDVGNTTVGYVANNAHTKKDGTQTASEIYGRLGKYCVVEVVSSTPNDVICRIADADFKKDKITEYFIKDRTDGEYPFGAEDEYPFEFCLTEISPLESNFIPEEILIYLICFDLGIEENQYNDINKFFESINNDDNMCYFETYTIMSSIKKKDKKHIAEILISEAANDDYDLEISEALKMAEKIYDVLARNSKE